MIAPRDAIVADFMARLALANPGGENELMPSGDPISFPAFHVFDPGHKTDQSEPGVNRYTLDLILEGYVESAGGTEAHAELTALYAVAVAAIMAEPPLGGAAETVDEGDLSISVATLADQRRLGFSLNFPITFPAYRVDPARPI